MGHVVHLLTRQWLVGLGMLAIVLGGLTACTAPPPFAPHTPTPAPNALVAPAAGTAVAQTKGGRKKQRDGAETAETGVSCSAYAAWMADPTIKAAMAKSSLWPDVVAAGEKAAAGESVDRATMQQAYDQMAKLASDLRGAAAAKGDTELTRLAGHAMGAASRLAGGLASGNLDQQEAGDALTELRQAIDAYNAEVAAEQAQCGQS
jgi:hypothetical protein